MEQEYKQGAETDDNGREDHLEVTVVEQGNKTEGV